MSKSLSGSNKKHKKVYSSGMADKIERATRKQAKQLKESGFSQQFDTIMLENYDSTPVGINQSNVMKNGNEVTYDTSLQRDIDFKSGYSEFGPTQMHYDVVEDFDRMTSNMAPHTSRREYQYNKNYDTKLALQTGVDDLYMSKDTFDPKTLFEPMRDLTFVNGAPVQTDLLEERYLPSVKNNFGELPFETDIRDQPGLFGENFPKDTVYRFLPKNIDELRSKTNKKVTYEADKVEAVKMGEGKRGITGEQTKTKKKSYRDRDINDYLPNSASANKQLLPGKYRDSNTNRSTSKKVIGTAYNPNLGHKKISKFTDSKKHSFFDDSISRGAGNVSNKPVLQNKKSFRNVENERTSTNHNITGSVYKPEEATYVLNPEYVPLTTLRQLMIDGDTNIGVTGQENKNYVFSNDMVLPDNNRVTTVVNENELNVRGDQNTGHYYNSKDGARKTIKESTTHNETVAPIQTTNNFVGHYFNNYDTARETVRQSTEIQQKEGFMGTNQATYAKNNDIAKQTVKQTTEFSKDEGIVTNPYTQGYLYNMKEKAKPTVKETTSNLVVQSSLQPDYFAPNYVFEDSAKETVKETTELSKYQGILTGDNYAGHYFDENDVAKDTIKQTTELSSNQGNLTSLNPQAYLYNSKEKAKSTIKETTEANTYEGNQKTTTGGTSYLKNNDLAKQTIKENTMYSDNEINLSKSSLGNYVKDEKDIARDTIKQTNLYSTGDGNLNNTSGNIGYNRDKKLNAKPTIKHSTLYSTGNGNLGRENAESGYYKDKNMKTKATIKETTLHPTQQGRLGRENGEVGYYKDKNDKAKTTIKQTTLLKNRTGPVFAEVEKHTLQNAEKNMSIDERREILTYNRPAGPKSDLVGPVINKKTVKLKKPQFVKRDNYGFNREGCNLGQLNQSYTRNKQLLQTANYRINDDYITTLHNNPLVNDLMHQKR